MDARAKGVPMNKHVFRALRRAIGTQRFTQLTAAVDTWPHSVPQIQKHQQLPAAGAMHGSTVQRCCQVKRLTPSGNVHAYLEAGVH
mmetsp:Transcript_79446/g.153616  ORF Transcript_79446/g.153616 Transcript_79446/m.153616 type:complete len:86 (+) Transcript_79446:2-259(+)